MGATNDRDRLVPSGALHAPASVHEMKIDELDGLIAQAPPKILSSYVLLDMRECKKI